MCVSRLKHKTFTRAYSNNEENLLKQSMHSKNAVIGALADTHTHTQTHSITSNKFPGKSARLLKQ